MRNEILMIILGIISSITGLGILLRPLAGGSVMQNEPSLTYVFMLAGLIIIIAGIALTAFGIKGLRKPRT